MLTYATVCQHCNDSTVLHLTGPRCASDRLHRERERPAGRGTARYRTRAPVIVISPSRCLTCNCEVSVSFRLTEPAFRGLVERHLPGAPPWPELVDDEALFARVRGDLRTLAVPESIRLHVIAA